MTEKKRRAIGKKLRFEVFKRDSFTCQYCGAQAPQAVMQVDHIDPVAAGGGNDLMNLITSCEDCNAGKGARELSDDSAITKQKAQLDALNTRREQLEMLLEWRQGLANLDDLQIDAFNDEFERATGCVLNENGRAKLKGWLNSHSIKDLLEGLDDSLATYYKTGSEDSDENNALASEAFNMTIRVVRSKKRYADKPYMKDLFYTRGIIRNTMYCNDRVAIELLEHAFLLGATIDELQDWAKKASNWTNWKNEMLIWINELEEAQGSGEPTT